MRAMFAFLVAAAALGQDAPPADPITDRLRYEIAAAQRDYLVTKIQLDAMIAQTKEKKQYDAAIALIQSKMEQADKACGGKFDPQSFACVNKEN